MNPIFRNVLAVIAGWLIGGAVNMGIILMGHGILPIEGVEPNDVEALAEAMPGLGAEYFIFPFLAHALGTLIGAIAAGFVAATHKIIMALVIGVLFMAGGITACDTIPAPEWVIATDL